MKSGCLVTFDGQPMRTLAGAEMMETFGGFAFAREYQIERKWCEVGLYRTAPISNNNVVLNFISQNILGLPRSYEITSYDPVSS